MPPRRIIGLACLALALSGCSAATRQPDSEATLTPVSVLPESNRGPDVKQIPLMIPYSATMTPDPGRTGTIPPEDMDLILSGSSTITIEHTLIRDQQATLQREYTLSQYTFSIVATPEEVLKLYTAQLPRYGWSHVCAPRALGAPPATQLFCIGYGGPFDANFAAHALYENRNQAAELNITLTSDGDKTRIEVVKIIVHQMTFIDTFR